MMRGLLAIDIDGTLTAKREELSQEVIDYLHSLVRDGWQILFVTGRTVQWSLHLLENLPFSYTFSAFNGAYTVLMPEKRVVDERYCACTLLEPISTLLEKSDTALVVYGDPKKDRRSFYFNKDASNDLRNHLEKRFTSLHEEWALLNAPSQITIDRFIALRAFCHPDVAKALSAEIEAGLHVHAPAMTDSYDSRFAIVQITHGEVSKGAALTALYNRLGRQGKVIACGDDYNDISMLQQADCRVVMATAPADVLAFADIIAPPAKENGIIAGLEQAINR